MCSVCEIRKEGDAYPELEAYLSSIVVLVVREDCRFKLAVVECCRGWILGRPLKTA